MTSSNPETPSGSAMRSSIIDYWNKALLCSRESSTSHADPDLAHLDNAIENQVLEELLSAHPFRRRRCLDVGAGYGRFTDLFRRYYSRVVLLEPAERIFAELAGLWREEAGVECQDVPFELYVDSYPFDLIFTSGVLYLYDDDMLDSFAQKAISMLSDNGRFVVRDFVAVPDRHVVASHYVQHGHCYYRTPQFWYSMANRLGLQVLEIRRSKPSLALLRNGWTLSLLQRLGLKRICRHRLAARIAMRIGSFRTDSRGIHTVFIAMRLL